MTFAFGKILFAVFLLFFAINSVLGLYKLQPAEGKEGEPNLLVPKTMAKNDYIYLYQFNRTSFAPTQAPLNQFIEGLLILMGVKFHRVPNQFFLGSQSTGAAPFIQYNGEYHDGVEKILEFLKKNFKNEMKKLPIFKHKIMKLPMPTFNKDKEVQDFALDFSFKVLMKDRSRRPSKEEGNKASISIKTIPPIQKSSKQEMTEEEKKANSEMEGLDFMLYDQGIREQLFPAVPNQLGKRDEPIPIGEFKLYEMSRKFLTAYFNAAYDGGKRNAKEIEANVIGLKLNENWDEFHRAMEGYITGVLHTVLIKNKKNSSEEKLKPLLEQNTYASIFGRRPYAKIDEAELYNIFMEKLTKLKIISTLDKTKKFLTGDEPSIADMALFSILEQFFETPLNIPEFKQLFQPERLNDDDNTKLNGKSKKDKDKKYGGKNVEEIREILRSFYEQMKEKLGAGKERWNVLTQKPWPLNYEDIWREEYSDKFDGPYIIDTDELNNLQNVDNSDSEIKNESESMLAEVINEVKEKAKEMLENGKVRNLTEKKLIEMMLAETAAYLCNLGPGKDSDKGKKCRVIHHEKNNEEITNEIQMKTRKVVYGTIVDYNDRLVRDKVTMETNRVADMLTEHPNNVAKYSSSLKIGNEN